MTEQSNNPLHGVTLKALLEALVKQHGWETLAKQVDIRCFKNEPSVQSSLKFLRRTPWARAKVEAIYLADQRVVARNRKRNKRRADQRAFQASQGATRSDDDAGTTEAP